MDGTTAYWVFATALVVIGLIGLIFPGIPGAPLIYLGLLLAAWAEGFYVSSIKRNGQALEARVVVDELFDADPGARILVCGDLNAGEHEVPLAILRATVEDTGVTPTSRKPTPMRCSTMRFTSRHLRVTVTRVPTRPFSAPRSGWSLAMMSS